VATWWYDSTTGVWHQNLDLHMSIRSTPAAVAYNSEILVAMVLAAVRAAFAHCAFTGVSRDHLGLLLTELHPAWSAAGEDPAAHPPHP
jgi:hypothetical protein